jgi:glutamyl-tRNA reductase
MMPTLDQEDPEAVRQAIYRRGEELERREVARAVTRLGGEESLTMRQREIISRMAVGVVDGILATPDAVLQNASKDDDAVRTAIELFDPDR